MFEIYKKRRLLGGKLVKIKDQKYLKEEGEKKKTFCVKFFFSCWAITNNIPYEILWILYDKTHSRGNKIYFAKYIFHNI